jgi:hypothetical protein
MKLQFTNGYRPRFDLISRIMQYIFSRNEGKNILRKDIIDSLGIPDKQVENLSSMMTGFGLVKATKTGTLTPLGKTITENDPYFENVATLWIIHYIVSSNPRWVVWHRVINQVIPMHHEITIELVQNNYLQNLDAHYSEKTIKEKLPKEIGAVLASYTRSELSRLEILDVGDGGKYMKGDPIEIPFLSFLFSVIYFRDVFSPGSTAVEIHQIATAENSPGLVFNIPEYQVRAFLNEAKEKEIVNIEQFGNLDQVRFSSKASQDEVLRMLYEENYGA